MQTFTLDAMRTEHPDVFPQLIHQMQQSHCSRCGGTMIEETYMDIFSDYEDFQFQAKHCIQCGDVIDPFILLNRLRKNHVGTPAMHSLSQARHRENGLVMTG
jgi:ribosomal protein S27AE